MHRRLSVKRLVGLVLLLVPGFAYADTYPITKLLNLSDKAVIKIGEDDFVQKGDRLYLENPFGTCRVRVLATKPNKALISIRRCDFEVNIRDVVTSDRIHGLDKSTDKRVADYSDENDVDKESDTERQKISSGRYIGGGIVSLFLGFGIGHAIQGRYSSGGWLFTASQIGGIALLTAGLGQAVENSNSCPAYSRYCPSSRELKGGGLIVAGYLTLVGSRIAEMIAVWIVNEEQYDIVSKPEISHYSLLPHLTSEGRAGIELAVSISIP